MIAPTWNEFSLMDLFLDTPSLQDCDVLLDQQKISYLYRYAGTEIVNSRNRMAKPDFTGLRFDEVQYQYDFPDIHAAMDQVASTCTPFHMIREFDARDARGTQERLILPLIQSQGVIDKLVVSRARLENLPKHSLEVGK